MDEAFVREPESSWGNPWAVQWYFDIQPSAIHCNVSKFPQQMKGFGGMFQDVSEHDEIDFLRLWILYATNSGYWLDVGDFIDESFNAFKIRYELPGISPIVENGSGRSCRGP